jgi:orotate phosphoribosyltransferase
MSAASAVKTITPENSVLPPDAAVARRVARLLLDIKAVNFRSDPPYIFTSGKASPVYTDCRKIISFPKVRSELCDLGAARIRETADTFDAVAGGETAGIPFAAWISERLNSPMLYIRKQPKGFGRGAQIEGEFPDNAKLVLVEDLATDAGSKVNFVNAIRKADAKVDLAFVVFFYGIFPEAKTTLASLGVQLLYLTSWPDVLKAAEEGRDFSPDVLRDVREYLAAPNEWSKAHGGK